MTTLDQREAEADGAAAARDFVAAERILVGLVADAPDRGESWVKLASIRRALGDRQGALKALSGALRLDPLAFVPLLMKASLLDALGESEQAGELYAAALFHCPPEDKLSPAMRAQVDHARERHSAYVERRESAFRRAVSEVLKNADELERKRIQRFGSNVVRRTRHFPQNPTHFAFPELPAVEFFPRRLFPFLAELEAATQDILAEFETVASALDADIVPYVDHPDEIPGQMPELNRSRDWSAIHLLAYGKRIEANAHHCPRTMALFAGFDQPQIPHRAPNLMFSLLAPHTRIPPHTGVSNARLVLHLPLIVPPNCGFRVGGETREWVPGEAFVFDDTIEHEAWNDSNEPRVILIGDLWRPELSSVERAAVAAIISASDAPEML